ncbi:MAG: hypothetical protein M1457_09030, partial [bacterium]|nr:hypothetical protein [bacterium]
MADRLKILVVSDVFPYPLHDGNRLSIYHFLRVLARRVDYTLLACRPEATGRDLGPETEALTEAFEEGRRRLAGHGIAVETAAPPVGGRAARALACLAAGRPWVNRFFSPTLAALVAERLARGGWDVVQAESILGAQHLPRDFGRRGGAPARHGPPSVLIARDCLSLRHWRAFRRGGAPRELLGWAKIRWMERALFRRFDRIMAIAEVDRHAMARLAAGRPVGLLPNGVDCAALRPDPAREEPDTVAFTGAMDYPPNVDAAVFFVRQIWPAVRRRRPGARLLIIGRDPTEAVRRLGD